MPTRAIPRHLSSPPSGKRASYNEALGDLRRSLDDGEQRFVSRMREWEDQQSNKRYGGRGRTPLSPLHNRPLEYPELEDDDVDIVLNSDPINASPLDNASTLNSRDAQASSMEFMDEDEQDSSYNSTDIHFSDESDEDAGELSSFVSVSEDNSPLRAGRAFSLSSTTSSLLSLSESSNSSIASLAIPPSIFPPRTRTDKAVAALALAIANGAAGLQDYQDILDDRSYLEQREAGALWR